VLSMQDAVLPLRCFTVKWVGGSNGTSESESVGVLRIDGRAG